MMMISEDTWTCAALQQCKKKRKEKKVFPYNLEISIYTLSLLGILRKTYFYLQCDTHITRTGLALQFSAYACARVGTRVI